MDKPLVLLHPTELTTMRIGGAVPNRISVGKSWRMGGDSLAIRAFLCYTAD